MNSRTRTTLPIPAVRRAAGVLAVGLLAVGLAACGSDDDASDDASSDPAAGACPEGDTDCFETGAEGAGDGGEGGDGIDEAAVLAVAESLIGTPEDEIPDDVRIGRRGEEFFPLTADYRVGRITVELDESDDGYVVTSAVVELTDSTVEVPS